MKNIKAALNFDYGFVQGAHNFLMASLISLASMILLSKGYSNSSVGIVIALGSIASILSQSIMSNYVDMHPGVSVFKISIYITLVIIALTGFAIVVNVKSILFSLLYVLILMSFYTLNPIINSLIFRLRSTGYDVNFGICRSVGSVTYAIMCSIVGVVNEKYGAWLIMLIGIASACLFIISVIKAGKDCAYANEHAPEGFVLQTIKKEELEEKVTYPQFIKNNILFVSTIIGLIMMSFGMTIFSNYILPLVESIGGNSADAGNILGFSAWFELPIFFLFARLSKKYKASTLLKVAAIAYVIKLSFFAFANNITMLYIGQAFQFCSWPLQYAAMLVFIDQSFSKAENMRGHALYSMQNNITTIIATFFGGMIIDSFGVHNALLGSLVFCVIGALIFWACVGKIQKKLDERATQ